MGSGTSENERRLHARSETGAIAWVRAARAERNEYTVQNLSAGGGLLSGEPRLNVGAAVKLALHVPGSQPIDLLGRVTRHADERSAAVQFVHEDDMTQDQIQSALLLELEQRLAAGS